jgi:hypothetical protein
LLELTEQLHRQHAFGMAFLTQGRALEELLPQLSGSLEAASSPQVRIAWGPTPEQLPAPIVSRGLFAASKDAILFSVPQVARYLVTRQDITVTPCDGASDEEVRLFLCGSALGAALHLNGILALHGSAVCLPNGGAAVFTGVSTAGKSTLASAMVQRGHPALADDIVAVHFDASGRAWVHPGLARTKLWQDTLNMLSIDKGERQRVRPDLDKYSIPVDTWPHPEPLTHLYELLPTDSGELSKVQVKGLEKLKVLDRQTFRPQFVEALDIKGPHMQRLAQACAQVAVFQVTRPRGKPTLEPLMDMLSADWA